MGRPPSNGAPSFRFNHTEVAQMEVILREHEGQVPTREYLVALAEKFSNAPERAGKVTVQMKQAWNWFQNRRYALRSKLVKSPGKLNLSPMPREEVALVRNVPHARQQIPLSSGHNIVRSASETSQMEFEAKSARDGAWYDVQAFLSHRYLETGNPEVLVRFAGFGPEEDEWINVRKHVRQRSLPCESSECVAVCPADLILCFQEGKEQALYFDAHVLDAQRRRHDIRGCRCRFLVRYDHDQSEEIVPLRKICRRPETDHRLQILHAANEAAAAVSLDLQTQQKPSVDPSSSSSTILRVANPNPTSTPSIAPPPPLPSNNISLPVGPSALSPFPPVGSTAPSPFPLVADPTSSSFPPVGPTVPSPFPVVVDSTPPSSLPSVGPTAPSPFSLVAPTAVSSLPSVGPTAPSSFPSVAPAALSSLPIVGPTDPSSLPSVGPTALSTPTAVAVAATVPVTVSTPDVQVPVPDPSLPIPVPVSETSMVQSDTPGVSIDEAASQENIACSSEARKTENVSVLSNPQLEQVVSYSTKAIAEMPGEPEKSECGTNSAHPELQVTSATLPTEEVKEE